MKDDRLQCCTEPWKLKCSSHDFNAPNEFAPRGGLGAWSCDHTGG